MSLNNAEIFEVGDGPGGRGGAVGVAVAGAGGDRAAGEDEDGESGAVSAETSGERRKDF